MEFKVYVLMIYRFSTPMRMRMEKILLPVLISGAEQRDQHRELRSLAGFVVDGDSQATYYLHDRLL